LPEHSRADFEKIRLRLAGNRFDVNATTLPVEENRAFGQRKERVIVALTDIGPRMESVSDLTDEDITSPNRFTAILLDTTSLGVGVTSVAAGSLTFLMSHRLIPAGAVFLADRAWPT
jgi:hypothetical protein